MFLIAEREYIIEVIQKELSLNDTPRATITAPFINTKFPELLMDGDFKVMAYHAVYLCERDGFQNNPPWMEQLFKPFNLIQTNIKVAEIWARVKSNPVSTVDPKKTTQLKSGYPFINRSNLRHLLENLLEPHASLKPILVVNGIPKSGKSYSTFYIQHLTFLNNIDVFSVKIDPGKELEKGATEIAYDLVKYMGLPTNDIPTDSTNLKRYIGELAAWVAQKSYQREYNSWFVFDNFSMDGLRPDAVDFLIAFSDLITNGVYPRKLKMIIIGFDRARLSVDPGRIDEEDILLPTLAEIDAAIEEIIQVIKPIPKAETLEAIYDYVKLNLPELPEKMGELNQRLRNLIIAIPVVENIVAQKPGIEFDDVLLTMLAQLPAGKESEKELNNRLRTMQLSIQEV